MKLYLDSADPLEIEEAMSCGFLAGVTTNPTLLAQAQVPPRVQMRKILQLSRPGIVFFQVVSKEKENIVQEARRLAQLEPARVIIKVPLSPQSLPAITRLRKEG